MNPRTLLRCYPRDWRARYGGEFLALLEATRVTPVVALDVLRGAADAHLHGPVAPADETPGQRTLRSLLALRTTAIGVFCAFIAFVVAGLAFLGMVDDSPFAPAMRHHVALNACWLTVEAGSAVALLAVIAGGLPIGLATLALARIRRDIRLLLGVPVLALVVEAIAIALLFATGDGLLPTPLPIANTATGEPSPIGNIVLELANGALFVVGAIASTAAVAVAIGRGEVGAHVFRFQGRAIEVSPYRFALLPAHFAAVAMGVMLVGTFGWGLVARSVAREAFTVGPLLAWLAIVATMIIATLVATVAVARGRRVGSQLVDR